MIRSVKINGLEQVLNLARNQGVKCISLSKKELDQRSGEQRHQGVVIEAAETENQQSLEQLLDNLDHPAFLLVLDGVTDPHNLGACLRTADAAGVDAVIVPKDKSAGINPTVRKVACGAAETMPFYQVTNLARTLEMIKDKGVWTIGTAGETDQELYDMDLAGPLAIIMGAEGKGMRRLTREHCDHLAKLPMAGSVSSLKCLCSDGRLPF